MATITFYNSYKKQLLDGNIDMVNDTIKLMLVTNAYTPNIDTHDFIDDVDSNEASGTGYTAGGFTLATKTVTTDTSNDEADFDCADVSASTVTVTYQYAVLYKDTGSASTSPVIGYVDYTSDQVVTAGDITFTMASGGIISLS